MRPHGFENCGGSTGVAEVLHQEAAGGHKVHEQRDVTTQTVEVGMGEVDPHTTGQGQQMDHRIGGPADRGMGQDSVLKSLSGENVGWLDVLPHQIDDTAAGEVSEGFPPSIDAGEGGVVRQAQAQGFDNAGHGGGRAHGVASAVTAAIAGLCAHEIGQGHLAGADFLRKPPDVGAGANRFSLKSAVQHGAGGQDDGGEIDAGGAHQLPGGRLVAAAQQDHSVNGVGADGFLHLHRQQVPEQHSRRPHLGFRQAHGGEFDRNAARLPNASLHEFGQVAEMELASDQFRPRVADSDDRATVKGICREPGALQPTAMNETIAIELAVALGAAQRFTAQWGVLELEWVAGSFTLRTWGAQVRRRRGQS